MIIYDPDENYSYSRSKIGDGETTINDLPFTDKVVKDYADSKFSDCAPKEHSHTEYADKIHTHIVNILLNTRIFLAKPILHINMIIYMMLKAQQNKLKMTY